MPKVLLSQEASGNLLKLPANERKKVIKKLKLLKEVPFLGKKLSGILDEHFSLRAWPYRIIYKFEKKENLVIVLKVAHRQGVYN